VSIYKRSDNGIYWFKYMANGRLVRVSTHQTSDKTARKMEATHRARTAKEHDDEQAARERLNCSDVARCASCEKLFDAHTMVSDGSNQVFCSNGCIIKWRREHTAIPTVGEFIRDRFEPWARTKFQKEATRTWDSWYEPGIKTILSYSPLCDRLLMEVTSEHVAEFAAHIRTEGLAGRPLAAASANARLRVLRRSFRLAVEWGALDKAPKVKLESGERHRERVLSPEEEAKYLAAGCPLLADVATVLVDSGMRPEECFRMRWESETWVNGRHGTIFLAHGKTKAARRVLPMTPRVRAILEARWEQAGKPEEGWVWPAETKSGHVEGFTFKKQHRKALNSCGVRPFVIYSFRHTFATRIAPRVDAWTLCKIMG